MKVVRQRFQAFHHSRTERPIHRFLQNIGKHAKLIGRMKQPAGTGRIREISNSPLTGAERISTSPRRFTGTCVGPEEQRSAQGKKAATKHSRLHVKSAISSSRFSARCIHSEAQLRIMIDTIPALAWCCLHDGANEFTQQTMARLHRAFTGRGSRLGMATRISSGRSGKASWRSGEPFWLPENRAGRKPACGGSMESIGGS